MSLQASGEGVGTAVTWLELSVAGGSPLCDEVDDLQVGPVLDDDEAQAQAAHGQCGLLRFAQVVYRGLALEADLSI